MANEQLSYDFGIEYANRMFPGIRIPALGLWGTVLDLSKDDLASLYREVEISDYKEARSTRRRR